MVFCKTIAMTMEVIMMSRCARSFWSLIKTGIVLAPIALAAIPHAPAFAVSGPYQVLYIFPGVRDTGTAAGTGVATTVVCFSFSPSTESIQYVVRNFGGTIAVNTTYPINSFQTVTASTHDAILYDEDLYLSTGTIDQGVLGISATSTNVVCTAQVIDASASVPNGIDLHGTRFNPISGSQE
jgi:hypothetical protein